MATLPPDESTFDLKDTMLADSDVLRRCEQLDACAGAVDAESVDFMVGCLSHSEPLVQWHAGEALAASARNLQGSMSIADLMDLDASSPKLDVLIEHMREALQSESAQGRAVVAEALAQWSCQPAVGLLLDALTDPADTVRAAAARGLGEMGAVEATEALVAALDDESLWVKRAAAHALGKIGDTRAVDVLANLALEGPLLGRTSAIDALSHLPTAKSRRTLVRCLTDAHGETRWYAARALGEIGSGAVLEPLQALAGDDFVLFDQTVHDVAHKSLESIAERGGGPWHTGQLAIFRVRAWLRRFGKRREAVRDA